MSIYLITLIKPLGVSTLEEMKGQEETKMVEISYLKIKMENLLMSVKKLVSMAQ